MYRATIVYAPADEQMRQLARSLEASLDKSRYQVTLKRASQAHLPDLAAADLFFLGSAPQGREAIHADFGEMVRALAGISLAGRVAGVFAFNSEATLKAFRRALKDCELVLSEDNFLDLRSPEQGAVELQRWAAGLSRQLEELVASR